MLLLFVLAKLDFLDLPPATASPANAAVRASEKFLQHQVTIRRFVLI